MGIQKEECLTMDIIDGYLEYLEGKGRSSSSLESYRRTLKGIYEYLPEGKRIEEGTGMGWVVKRRRYAFPCTNVPKHFTFNH